ncbi:Clp protease N-terminal domain-containing protein [Streptomyces sp. NPDC059076]|uniref:Clp protease N-terminal domain-containing protein n=1 Tax=unclassified Streptomyces TaxID=2593676 RepID=UPI0036BCBFEF
MTSHSGQGPTPIVVEPDWSTAGVLGAARGARDDDGPIGTEQLLAALTDEGSTARRALADARVTKTVMLSLLRDRAGRPDAWTSTDGIARSVDIQVALGEHAAKGVQLTGAARRAVDTAMAAAVQQRAKKLTTVMLLRAVLQDEQSRAAEALRICGTTPAAVIALIDGAEPDPDDGLDLMLWKTRDGLLGHRAYRSLGFFKRWLVISAGVNWASTPIAWVKMEAEVHVKWLGHDEQRTEHLLLAVLATHEVAVHYPHLAAEGLAGADLLDTRYAGGRRLHEMGVDYASVWAAIERDESERFALGAEDSRAVGKYLDAAASDSGTGPLVEALLRDDTRARRLVEALGAVDG